MSAVSSAVQQVVAELQDLLGPRVTTAEAVREHHGQDESWHRPELPEAVCFAHTSDEVRGIVEICARHRTPIIPFGTGTSLEGHVMAPLGGVCIDLSEMREILEVNADDMDCTVQAGVTHRQLNKHLKHTGLFFPLDPGADASLGGMAATRASGTTAVRYGTMRENVLALNVVLADGRIIRTARRARKSSAGYDLTRLFVGSEGTLGVITEVTLRLQGIPEAISSAVVSFPDIAGAVNTTIATIQAGVPVARIELLDEESMDAVNRYSGFDYPVQPTLFLEFHGSTSSVEEDAQIVSQLCKDFGGGDFRWAVDATERNRLWQARHDCAYAAQALRPEARWLTTDVCVPISRLTECIVETKADFAKTNLLAPLVGHVGDGNFHLLILIDPDNADEVSEANELNDRLVMRALRMNGTCTGEHGVGLGKMKFLEAEHGEGLSVMRSLKQALDPHNIMNPGKMISPGSD